MERDWNIIRAILQQLENKESYGDVLRPESVKGYDVELVSYHMHLLNQAGIIDAKCQSRSSGKGSIFCLGMNLTWEGHELLDSIKSDSAWNRLQKLLREKSIDLSYQAVKTAAVHIIKNTLL